MKIADILLENLSAINKTDMELWLKRPSIEDISPSSVNLSKFEKTKAKLEKIVRSNTIELYRAISVFDQDDIENVVKQKSNAIGTSWTYNVDNADVYRGFNPAFEKKYIIVAKVTYSNIDILATLALNMVSVRGDFEAEVRLKPNQQIRIVDILDFDSKKSLKISARAST